ncbi:MAG: RidA family protein, partial [Planctomycetales bacterium]|nr:RidA family protein [Planctomycetales bacterium]
SVEARLTELGIQLPPAPKILGLYRPVFVCGSLAYTSGHGPISADGSAVLGRLGEGLSVDEGRAAARTTALAMLSSLRAELGSLDRVRRLVKTVGLVNSAPSFTEHPAVINGFSEVLRDVFGEQHGIAARSALGVAALPAGWAVEIEAVFELAE